MKNIKSILFVLATALLFFQGCDSLLDVDPNQSIASEQALTNATNVKSVLVGAYDAIGDDDLYGGWYMMTADFLAAAGEFDFTGTFFAPREIWSKNQLYDNGQLTATWNASYDAINITNNVLSALDLLEGAERDRVEGEAKLIRAMVYFELVRLYADPYEAGQANGQAGVPLVLEPTTEIGEEANVSRSTVDEVYNQIIADLTDAKNLLDDVNPERSFYVNSMVASAVLSRVHLQRGEYGPARDEADRVIGSGLYSLRPTFADVFNQPENTSEDIFAMQNSAQDGVNSLFTFYSSASRGDIAVNQQHLDEYEAADDRLNLFYIDPDDGVTIRSGKWNRAVDDNVNIIRLAEMYLTRAEGNFRLGEAVGDEPLDDINLIRDRVNLAPLAPADLDLDAILLERKLELMFEGNLLHDIKRTQRNVGARPYDDPKLVLPIPRREIDVNPNMCQNPTYTGPQC
ncbi:RagB/SusD family nutrient uptake outer membrane protein [Rhodohalobacter mucosus]|uniref:RagB/SusD family nutrient uptake outer membrane protein n=1 Tax=Rhodohalobacter mucosus TaxID=2079485 RepID=A0A316TYS1_9BACT|nr:RagB/SusD family nutrient uptake outer membrane protein [Rhodohalobacter mucosus]PWN07974.1 RagB/SusD family nutrient uptake outer membrane protein [Rhodohalobacter mucosus]